MISAILALSVRQPFAAALFRGKSIEVRSRFPGGRNPQIGETILIHAGKEVWAGWEGLENWESSPFALRDFWRKPDALPRGCIVGDAVFTGVERYRTAEEFAADAEEHWNNPAWFESAKNEGGCLVGLKFRDAREWREPVPFRGALGWFVVKTDTLAEVERASG
jgi:hypothetical protein